MYKKIIFVTLALFLIVMIPQMSIASSFSLRSSSKTVEPNKTFTLSVYVTPSSTNVYTAQANINFPADLVSVESFTYAGSWFPMNQPGNDLIDNIGGKLIKTAGYPGGFSTETLLGTLVLKSKKAGFISISVNKESFILDMDSNDVLNSYGTFSLTSSTPTVYVPPVTPPVTPPTNPTTPKNNNPVVPKDNIPVKTDTPVETPDEPKDESFNENIYKENVITNLLFLFTGASVVDKIITNSFHFN